MSTHTGKHSHLLTVQDLTDVRSWPDQARVSILMTAIDAPILGDLVGIAAVFGGAAAHAQC